MWPFNRKTRVHEATAKDLRDAIFRHEQMLIHLKEMYEDLHDKHTRLRGKVYAHGIHKTGVTDVPADGDGSTMSNPANAAPEVLSKAELRKRMGFVPGKPMVHKE